MTRRNYGFDNIKFILIFLVVFGHFVELSGGFPGAERTIKMIYSFHMPVFIFISGYFAKFNSRRIVFQYLYLYLLFQALYTLSWQFFFERVPLSQLTLQFSDPYRLMWFMLVMFFYFMLLPLLNQKTKASRAVVLLLCLAATLIAPFDERYQVPMSLGRFFSFLPFFVMGYYAANPCTPRKDNKKLFMILSSLGAVAVTVYLLWFCDLPFYLFYGKYAYKAMSCDVFDKIIAVAVPVLWTAFFYFTLIPLLNRNIPLISYMGKNTLPIYILHGFVYNVLGKIDLFNRGGKGSVLLLLGVSLLTTLLLGNPLSVKLFKIFCSGSWLERLWAKISTPKQEVLK